MGAPGGGGENSGREWAELALGVLWRLAGALEAVLLPLLDTGVAGEKAALAHDRAQGLIHAHEGAGDAVADGAGLTGMAPADDLDDHVIGHGEGGLGERLPDDRLERGATEVIGHLLAVDHNPA